MKTFLLFLSLLCAASLHADDIITTNRTGLFNVVFKQYRLAPDGSSFAVFLFNGAEQNIFATEILTIIRNPADPSALSTKRALTNEEIARIDSTIDLQRVKRDTARTAIAKPILMPKIKYPNIHFLSVSLIGAAFAYDQFKRVNDINNSIAALKLQNRNNLEIYKKYMPDVDLSALENVDYSYLENQRTTPLVLGIIGSVGTIVSLFYAFDAVTVSVSDNSLSLAVNF